MTSVLAGWVLADKLRHKELELYQVRVPRIKKASNLQKQGVTRRGSWS